MSATSPIKVKFLSKTDAKDIESLWSPLIPKAGFKNVEFTFDPHDTEYDFFVAYEGLPKWSERKTLECFETLTCSKANTLLITTEPSSIRLDGPHFMRQFGHVLTNKAPELVKHPNQIRETPPLRWFYGWPKDGTANFLSVDQISEESHSKTLDISTVCSTKQMSHTVHAARLKFVMALQERLPELDVYGRGIKSISDKSEAMRNYRYHIAIENHIEAGHWTEKLADCFLAECIPFYFGDPNYAEYFPKNSVIPIDIRDLDMAEKTIRKAIDDNEYHKRKDALLEAKKCVLEHYNTLGWVAQFVAKEMIYVSSELSEHIYSRHAFRRKYPMKAVADYSFRSIAKHKKAAQPLQITKTALI